MEAFDYLLSYDCMNTQTNISNGIGAIKRVIQENTIMKTQIIRYNLTERGRKHRGTERNFDLKAIADAINSPATQEKVKNRDMLGFYGHWARIKFGMNPAEGGIADGKAQSLEPAIVTVSLKADYQGNVEHIAEFLPTNAGQIAYKLWQGKTGGFSSAIDERKPEFFGFDYVLEPNYSTNRGFAFDSAFESACEGGICEVGMNRNDLDDAIYEEQISGLNRLLDSVTSEKEHQALFIEVLQGENEALKAQIEADKQAALDNIEPLRSPKNPKKPKMILDFVAQAKTFHQATLLERIAPKDTPIIDAQDQQDYNQLMQRMGVNR